MGDIIDELDNKAKQPEAKKPEVKQEEPIKEESFPVLLDVEEEKIDFVVGSQRYNKKRKIDEISQDKEDSP